MQDHEHLHPHTAQAGAAEPFGGGFSRRAFLRGSGAAAAATALATGQGLAEAQEKKKSKIVSGKGPATILLNVNGKDHKVQAEPRTTLIEVLRYQLKLTGCKPVSNDGVSGASTVLIDGKLVSASTALAVACVKKKIQTVESLGGAPPSGKGPDPVAKAFVHADASQCGFCTPGFVVTVRQFLDKNPKATEAQIRAGLNGNICRCGTYANVIQAALAVVKGGQ
ncbi:MAG TPA: (2Fe-2S)-binding protein [Pirellulales bacterium]|nr:(2Fe-2S)-binding protein [Pirellulales bacterium]